MCLGRALHVYTSHPFYLGGLFVCVFACLLGWSGGMPIFQVMHDSYSASVNLLLLEESFPPCV